MIKVLVLLLTISLALVSGARYLFISEKIAIGKEQLSAGQKDLEKGQSALEEGQTKLDAGKKDLSDGKKEYEQARSNVFLVFMDELLQSGKGFEEGREEIAEGDKTVAEGERAVDAGERKVQAGALEMKEGRELLSLAHRVRAACAMSAISFTVLSIILGFYWRRSVIGMFRKSDV
ncbi:hypothetical protein [Saccharospirillum salsuginis]|uniref:Uncharacterized protein n=1 Tax=Saccharospirillum salsuginis TaxID=418750 RepID=A0A918KUT7_9GAMM|nr:hypothetical protein [Saccharospirillum salsuginis]GGX74307.1 hypothetical protein GCM10007392_47100 [Saccharospirillum salsuginis]